MGVPSGSGAPVRSNAWPSVRMGIGGGGAVGPARKIDNAMTARRTRHPFVFARPVVSPPRSKASRRATLFSLLIHFQPWARLQRAEKGFKESSASSRSLEPKMVEVVECVPNFSEGRRKDVVDAIGSAIASVAGARVLDVQMDADHNRSVITFVGDRRAVSEAAFRGASAAVERIDMNVHRGEHPRVGALDVLPFVPIAGVTMEDCVALARAVGKRIADDLHVPVYLYEAAASRPDRRALPDVRRGEYEGLKAEIETNPDRKPDFGPARLHPTAGACIVGARPVLIAWNVNLRTPDVGVAKRIARAIRESDGGLPAVRAKGFALSERGLVQVSMNMVDYRRTSLVQAFEAILALAEKEGVEIAESEVVGLVPLDALVDGATQYFKLARFHRDQILETRLWE